MQGLAVGPLGVIQQVGVNQLPIIAKEITWQGQGQQKQIVYDMYNGTPPNNFVDSRFIEDEDEMRKVLRGGKPIRFDWENKWLRGDQYAHMLYNLDNYSAVFGMQKLGEKTHPENIYVQPESKLI